MSQFINVSIFLINNSIWVSILIQLMIIKIFSL